jgi:hypothetical protein
VRYMRAVIDDDFTIGERCCTAGGPWSPDWTEEETKALNSVYDEALPEWYTRLHHSSILADQNKATTITELAHDLATLRVAAAVLRAISTDDPDLQNAIAVINRKSFEYQGRYLSMQG